VFVVKKNKEKKFKKKEQKLSSQSTEIGEKTRDTLHCSYSAPERAFQNETLCFFARSFFLSFFEKRYLSLLCFSLLLLRAFRRALRSRRREKYHGDGKIIILVYRHLDGDHSSGVSVDRRGLQPERFEMRQEMGRGAIVWVTFTTI